MFPLTQDTDVRRLIIQFQSMSTFLESFERLCTDASIPLSEEQKTKMNTLYDVLVRENQKHNLTTVTDPEQAALRHFFDSIVPYKLLKENGLTLDVGSGAGFPCLPLAVMRPDVSMSALESVQKKCGHIALAAEEARIHVQVICERAEEAAGGPLRESFDDCVTRAVAALPILVELTAPFVKVGGKLFFYKADYEEELKQAKSGARKLGIVMRDVMPMPGEHLGHSILVFEKTEKTPEAYPRRYARIRKSPLR